MLREPLIIEDRGGLEEGQRILRLKGPILISNLFEFQNKVRTESSKALVLDFSEVPYVDSAGIGALVGAYVTHEKEGRSLTLVAVNERVRNALQVTRVEQFFRFVDSFP
jgi:anti-sigma B factor antagonist